MDREQHKERMRRRRRDKSRMRRKALKIFQTWLWVGPEADYEDWLESSVQGWADNLQKCSCPMCGNARRHFKTVTLQEKKFLDLFNDQMSCLD